MESKLQKWQKLSRTDISPSKWFPLSQNKVQLPNGQIIDDFFVAEFNDVAMVVPFLATGELVLVRQYKFGVDEIIIELPAGFQQPGKSIAETALAELEEEIGVQATLNSLEKIAEFTEYPTKVTSHTHVFLATNLEFNSSQKLDVTEDIEILKFAPLEVLEMIKSQKIWATSTIAAIFKTQLTHPDLFREL